MLTALFAHFGEGTVLKPTLRCDYGFNISIGDRAFINFDCVLLDGNRIAIGSEIQIAHPASTSARRRIRSTRSSVVPVSFED